MSVRPTAKVHAFCDANGRISYSDQPSIPGLARFACGRLEQIKPIVEVIARHAHDGETFLVPGIPEAENFHEASEALGRFINQFDQRRCGA